MVKNSFKYLLPTILICVFLSCKKESPKVGKVIGKQIPIEDTIATNSEIDEFIAPFRAHLNKAMDSIISYAPKDMHKKDGDLETTIGNLMADIVILEGNPIFNKRTSKNIDFSLLNYGGIRAPISKGDVTMRTAYEVMPFENAIVVVELAGNRVKELLEYLASKKRAHPVSGVKVLLNEDYSIKSFEINGEPFNEHRNYYVATSDYLQHGGDNMVFFKDPVNLYNIDYKIRNAMIDHFLKTDTIPAKLDGRFTRLKTK
ncbi:5'-nucleotidase C-terminal domain-containing protein [Sungkyunkwania multivorans]|uniref:5'-nucleotidase C-terminal domain-containing protein n=1 Tax=Sungkyunkwania multivorans TaxID=1173618 RepID=A0ABW3CXT4_9FLAO